MGEKSHLCRSLAVRGGRGARALAGHDVNLTYLPRMVPQLARIEFLRYRLDSSVASDGE